MTCRDQGQPSDLRPQRLHELRIDAAHARYDRRPGLALEPRQVGEACCGRIGDGEDVRGDGAARVEERHEMACCLDPTVAPMHAAYNSDVESRQQGAGRLQAACGIVVAGDDHRGHGRSRAAQAHQSVVEELLRLSRRVLAIEDVAGDDERIDGALDDDLFEPLKDLAVLPLARKSAQRLADMPVGGVQDTDHGRLPTKAWPSIALQPRYRGPDRGDEPATVAQYHDLCSRRLPLAAGRHPGRLRNYTSRSRAKIGPGCFARPWTNRLLLPAGRFFDEGRRCDLGRETGAARYRGELVISATPSSTYSYRGLCRAVLTTIEFVWPIFASILPNHGAI